MFIISLTYIVPLDELDRHMTAHVLFLKEYYAKNIFVASGRKVPRTGGVILALAKSACEVDEIMARDPFIKNKLATYESIEFLTSQVHDELKDFFKKNKR